MEVQKYLFGSNGLNFLLVFPGSVPVKNHGLDAILTLKAVPSVFYNECEVGQAGHLGFAVPQPMLKIHFQAKMFLQISCF